MTFQDSINQYINILDCTIKDLADASGLSVATVSRYKNGERKPSVDSIQLEKLVCGIVKLSLKNETITLNERDLLYEFKKTLMEKYDRYDIFSKNFNALADALKINTKDLAIAINFDASYIYRIRSGQRRPNDLENFSNLISSYIAYHHDSQSDKQIIADYLKCDISDFENDDSYFSCIKEALFLYNSKDEDEKMKTFLQKLDDFDLNEYIRAIHFDELKVPTVPFQFPTSKNYIGIEQMRQGELDFFKATVLSKSKEPIFMCSDMPMADMAKDVDFNKKWMFAIAMSLKKGLHLDIIHNIDRPFDEMMLGLEAWIPIYMTGQVSPYHLKNVSTDIYHHFNYVSGSTALVGECIEGFHEDGKYYLTNNKDEVAYYRKKANHLLQKASPLMDIYDKESKSKFDSFTSSNQLALANRNNILSTLPIYTISEEILSDYLEKTSITTEAKDAIMKYHSEQKALAIKVLENNYIVDVVPMISEEEFKKNPLCLSLSGLFFDEEIPYTYELYLKHLEETKQFASDHKNYSLKIDKKAAFRNIQIQIFDDQCVLISKNKSPVIHFAIHHPKMVYALKNFVAPVFIN